MIKTSSLLAKLAKRFPKRYAKVYHDYVGHMAGKIPEFVTRIYLALDFEASHLDDATSFNPDLVITHHPFLYGTRYQLSKTDPDKIALLERVEAKNLCVYSFHTNFDRGVGGMNDALAEALGLSDIKALETEPMARGGRLPYPMTPNQVASYAKTKLHVSYGLLLPYGKEVVSTVAIIGGGGSRNYKQALLEGYDMYISGDMPHHVRRGIINARYNYLDLPHEVESIFLEQMEKLLLDIDPTLIIKKAPRQIEAQVI